MGTKLKYTIAVDFDGTLVEDKWPYIGKPNMKLIRWLKFKQACGCEIILWTCREGELLDTAIRFLKTSCHFTPDWVNENPSERVELFKNDPRKISYDILIDDKATSCGFDLPFKTKTIKTRIFSFLENNVFRRK